ncbi:MAG: hypothetical protein D6691_05695 [Candidatus Hydrogenedentota bacterium]|nr:MAG: hypothetical protein D6691_05695 [Candidatus Hydrogenedentota bacterium]
MWQKGERVSSTKKNGSGAPSRSELIMVGPRTRWVHKEEDCDFSLLNFFEEKKEEIVFDFSPVLLTID